MADHWRAVLANDPFKVPHETISKLTNRDIWVYHLEPALRRAQKLRKSRDGEVSAPQTPEDIDQALATVQAILG